jgi:subtilase family serine protease
LLLTHPDGKPAVTLAPSGYSPGDFESAYNLPTTSPIPQTIALVDAYDDPTARRDLNTYDKAFGLPPFPACSATVKTGCFRKVNQSGNPSPLPKVSSGWALEISLDVQIAHAICQNCKILLVEAKTSSTWNLGKAVNTAVKLGATEVSNSYGGPPGNLAAASYYDHSGVAITAAAGDFGFGAQSPASYATVIAVGGTTLKLGTSGGYGSESVWSRTGSGCDPSIATPSWQSSLSNWPAVDCTGRSVADVAADANPKTGAAIYDSTALSGQFGWFRVGGTSLSSPLIAAVFALAGNDGSTPYPAQLLYQATGGLHDVTSGRNGSCGSIQCMAGPGYDGPTGLGTPDGVTAFAP